MIKVTLLESASVATNVCSIICSQDHFFLILSELSSALFQKLPHRLLNSVKDHGHLLGNLCSWLRASKRFNSVGRKREQLILKLLK